MTILAQVINLILSAFVHQTYIYYEVMDLCRPHFTNFLDWIIMIMSSNSIMSEGIHTGPIRRGKSGGLA